MTIREQATEAAAAARKLAAVSPVIKNKALEAMADALLAEQEEILAANTRDMEAGKAKGLKESLLDRLLLTPARLADMAEGLRQVAALKDPVGEIIGGPGCNRHHLRSPAQCDRGRDWSVHEER